MDHTPQVPADDRAVRLLEHSDLPADRKATLVGLVKRSQDLAAQAGEDLQAEFGREHVALIVGCNQFIRIWRAGHEPGAVELLLDPADKTLLADAGVPLREPDGAVFKLFGWVRADATPGQAEALDQAVGAAFRKAKAAQKPK